MRSYSDGFAGVSAIGTGYLFDFSGAVSYGPVQWHLADGTTSGIVYSPLVFAVPGSSFMPPITATSPVAQATDDLLVLQAEFDIE